jgi:hypothetical protein
MKNRSVYIVCVLFAVVGAIAFFGFAGNAVVEGRTKIALVFSAVGAGVAWLCWEFARAQKAIRRRYVISADQLISADDPKEAALNLSQVAQVVSDAHSGFISLRGVGGEELRRIHIDNPIVEELKVYSETPKRG